MPSWFASHRPLLATVTSGTVIAAVVAAVAIVSNGYTAQKMDLGDASVWVVNGEERVVGRANTEVLELNTVVRGESVDLEVVQSGSTVLLVDHANATIEPIDPATSRRGEGIALPPQQPQVYLAGDQLVIFAAGTGELWIVPTGELSVFDAASPPTLNLGTDAVVSVDPDGLLFAFSPEAEEVYRVNAAVSEQVERRWEVSLGAGNAQLSSVDGRWLLFDPITAVVVTDGGTRSIADVDALGTGVLQSPSRDGDRLLLATSAALLALPIDGGAPRVLTDDRSGTPAAPLVMDGCSFAAWSSGVAWRQCPGEDARTLTLQSMSGGAALSFLANDRRVVLNDSRDGGTWAVQQDGQLIDNWEELIEQQDEQEQLEENSDDNPPEVEEEQKAPVAVDDGFGARPGRATLLPVLLNDYDANADVLVITEVTGIDESIGTLDLVTRNQQLQLTLAPGAAGQFSFGYTISDGRGGVATAAVTVTVRSAGENSPPRQVRSTSTTVGSGGRVSTQVLGDWIDPDGDAFYLTSATTAQPDAASYKPDGVVVFSDSGQGEGVKSVSLSMSDGTASGNGSLSVTVRPVGDVPIVVEPWIVLATAGQAVTVRPLLHVRGGNGPIRLNAVPPKAGIKVEPSFEAGVFSFESDEVRSHYVEFTVTDGEQTATGLVRVDVAAPPDSNTRPITVPKTMFVTTLSSQTVDPTTTDFDPAGGVLVVTGVLNVPATGIKAEVIDQRLVRVTLESPLDTPVTINYRISNGLAEAEGTITVVEIPPPLSLQPPIATDDVVTVRAGDTIDIPVLANDEQPDGGVLSLSPTLSEPLQEGAGLLFASGDLLRYLAPETAGNYSAVYTVVGPDGQEAQARVLISVREKNAATNNPPVPVTVVARVIAGETVRIEIPLTGIDPDGDAVQLIGQETNPEKGAVLAMDGNAFEYEAGSYSSGTDTFRYTVVDGLGARATGTVRVGISASLAGSRNPVANDDVVRVRPGRTVSVQVLANDSDPDGRQLHVQSVVPNTEGTEAEIVEGAVVRITPPDAAGEYAVVYTAANQYGGQSSAFITVTVDPLAPLAYPVVRDTVLRVSDVLERSTVEVDVLDNVFFADGDVRDLDVGLLDGYVSSAQLVAGQLIRVTVGQRSQVIPFSVAHPDDPSVRSFGFIRVPGYDDALPQINPKAPPLRVNSEDTLVIDLDRYVVALGGSRVRLTDSSTVRATHANGDDLVVDDHTLEYTSADRYFGPASITFEVTDGSPSDDGTGHSAILSLPITVDPRENQPPVLRGAVVDFEPGQEKELDLVRLTDYPYDDDVDELEYDVLTPLPEGFTYDLNGQRLVLRANESAVKGSTTSIALSVRDAVNDGESGRITLRVVPSTRPMAKPQADSAVAKRGETTVIDVLANDQVNNPFPETPLRVVAIRGIDGANLPEGVSVSPSGDKSTLTVTISETAEPIDTNLQYQVADATDDPDRMTWGNVTISVQDVPDPVTNLNVIEFGDRLLKLAWTPGQFNNSPISEYRVTVSAASDGSTLSTVSCTATVGCTVATPGNGSGYAVRISVIAVNEIGDSDPTALPNAIWSDIIPPPPTSVSAAPLDHGLRVSWRKPDAGSGGSPISRYVVTVGGVRRVLSVSTNDAVGTLYELDVVDASLANGTLTTFSVSARNDAPNSLATWNQADGTGTPAGPPLVIASPVASGSVTDGTTVAVDWSGAFDGNGLAPSHYLVVISSDAGLDPSCVDGPGVRDVPAGTLSTTFTGLTPNQEYSIWVFADNGQGCTRAPRVEATPRAAPGTVDSVNVTVALPNGDAEWDFRLDGLTTVSGPADSFIYRLVGGTTEQSEYGPFAFGHYLTAGTTHYGNDVSVQVKACVNYPPVLCSGEWSAPFHLGTPVRLDMVGLDAIETLAPAPPDPGLGYWTWAAGPTAPPYESVTISCGPNDDPGTPVCEVQGGGGGPNAYPDLVVTIAANGTSYTREYSWTLY